jgi:hypothetical protein
LTVPVAIKLSKKFYDRFGDEIVNEFVELLNQVDATYKSELRDLVDAQFTRFDAIEKGLAEVRAELRLTASKAELSSIERRMEVGFADMRTAIEKGLKEQTRFFFLAWAALLASSIALWFR